MENLSKENYWNDLMERFPSSVKEFGDWFDKWKVQYWNRFFDERFYEFTLDHFPFEMQYGIIFKYFRDEKGMDSIFSFSMVQDWEIKDVITELFAAQFVKDIAKSDPDFILDDDF